VINWERESGKGENTAVADFDAERRIL